MTDSCSGRCGRVVWGLADAAGGEELLAGQPAGVVRGEEHGDGGDVADLAAATERSLFDRLLFPFRADDPGTRRAFGLDHARVDRVDTDLPRPEFLGEHAGDSVHRGFGAGV